MSVWLRDTRHQEESFASESKVYFPISSTMRNFANTWIHLLVQCCVFQAGALAPSQDSPKHALWTSERPQHKATECEAIDGIEILPIKPYQPEVDGFQWLHGVALAHYRGHLFASFGHNRGLENTVGEEARFMVSEDLGRSWSPARTMDAGDEDGVAVSHGVFLVHQDELWAFHGAFYDRLHRVHTRAYRFDADNRQWLPQGVAVADGFWPMQEPRKIGDVWLMAGLQVVDNLSRYNDSAAVALSRDDDFTTWELVVLPKPRELDLWGESTIFEARTSRGRRRIWNVARYRQPLALAAYSDDDGLSWTNLQESNLHMAASKPYAGTLPDGRNYLIGTTTSDNRNERSPLTLAVTAQESPVFERVFTIRGAEYASTTGVETGQNLKLSYPYAIQVGDSLLVGYSNDGGRGGNRNSAELAMIPIHALR